MIKLTPFKAVLMKNDKVKNCSCVPYDVIDTNQAARIVANNPDNFLAVTHSEVLYPKSDPTDDKIYKESLIQLEKLIANNIMYNDTKSALYIYKQEYKQKIQIGIIGLTSIKDYEENKIKKHELTRVDKEEDRIKHFYHCKSNTEPIFLFHKNNENLQSLTLKITITHNSIINFTDELDVTHIIYPVYDKSLIQTIQKEFNQMNSIYIADGHHRCASAYKVGQQLKSENPNHTGEESYNFNLSVIFPQSQLRILPYNRLVTFVDGNTDKILDRLENDFVVKKIPTFVLPARPQELVIFLKNNYYNLTLKKITLDNNPVNNLDVSIVQNLILEPIFNITDPRTSKKIKFFGGNSLEKEITNINDNSIAIFMYPTKIEDIMAVSDNNQIMPPKSTWFEPKLRSGLFLYRF